MIPHIALVLILFLSNTIAKPTPEVNEEVHFSDGVYEHTEEEEGSGFFKTVPRTVESEGSGEGSGDSEELGYSPRSGDGSGEFMILEAEMGSGKESEVILKLAEEEEMTTESEMMINNLVPRFDLEMGSGDSEELYKIISEDEGSGDGLVIKITTEDVEEGSGAEFRFAEDVGDEIGSGDDTTEASLTAAVRQVEVDYDEEIGEITTEFVP